MNRRFLLSALAALSLLTTGAGVAQAASPANDAFTAAATLAAGQEISGTNLEATSEPGEVSPVSLAQPKATSCGALAIGAEPRCGASVWFNFQAPAASEYTIETCDAGTDMDTVMGVYVGTKINALAKVGDNDDAIGLGCRAGVGLAGSRVSFAADAGAVYRVLVTGYRAERGSFYLRAYAGPAVKRADPDTRIERESSMAELLLAGLGVSPNGIISGPRQSASFDVRPTFPFGASFECSLDGAAFSACTPPTSQPGLAPGSSHTFAARASSPLLGGTDQTPVIERFTIDTAPPETAIAGTNGNIASDTGKWALSNTELGNDDEAWVCGIDSSPTAGCGSAVEIDELCKGAHTFSAAAFDRASNVDPTPATAQLQVTTGPACAPPTIGEPTASGITSTEVGNLAAPFDTKGAGGLLRVQYGLTTAYGQTARDQRVDPHQGTTNPGLRIRYLNPATTYHYKVTLTTPFGTVSTVPSTFTTASLGAETLPVITDPAVTASDHAASFSFTLDPEGPEAEFGIFLEEGGPVTGAAARVFGEEPTDPGTSAVPVGPVPVVDLKPGTTYHYRPFADQAGGGSTEVLGPEASFTTPLTLPVTPPPPAGGSGPAPITTQVAAPFVLKKKAVKVGKLKRDSKKLQVKVSGLPAKASVALKLTVGSAKQTATKVVKAGDAAVFTLTLTKKVREALAKEANKKAGIKVTAAPPGDPKSSVTLKPKIKD